MSLSVKAIRKVHKEAVALSIRKNNDYASMIDVIATTGKIGLVVRIFDKAARLLSLVLGAKQKVKDESVRDTAIDLVNYATYLVCIIDGTWGKKRKFANKQK